jgi:hypothetical protein
MGASGRGTCGGVGGEDTEAEEREEEERHEDGCRRRRRAYQAFTMIRGATNELDGIIILYGRSTTLKSFERSPVFGVL